MIRVGLAGEDPHDTSAVRNLLESRYKAKVNFIPLGKRYKGDQLETKKFKNELPIEFETKECDLVILIRDLDAFETDSDKLANRMKWFNDLNILVNNKGVLMLNIVELEALIFADIGPFNKMYDVNYISKENPMFIADPKKKLKKLTAYPKKQYKESDCPKIFMQLNVENIKKNCSCFKEFITEFNSRLQYLGASCDMPLISKSEPKVSW